MNVFLLLSGKCVWLLFSWKLDVRSVVVSCVSFLFVIIHCFFLLLSKVDDIFFRANLLTIENNARKNRSNRIQKKIFNKFVEYLWAWRGWVTNGNYVNIRYCAPFPENSVIFSSLFTTFRWKLIQRNNNNKQWWRKGKHKNHGQFVIGRCLRRLRREA